MLLAAMARTVGQTGLAGVIGGGVALTPVAPFLIEGFERLASVERAVVEIVETSRERDTALADRIQDFREAFVAADSRERATSVRLASMEVLLEQLVMRLAEVREGTDRQISVSAGFLREVERRIDSVESRLSSQEATLESWDAYRRRHEAVTRSGGENLPRNARRASEPVPFAQEAAEQGEDH